MNKLIAEILAQIFGYIIAAEEQSLTLKMTTNVRICGSISLSGGGILLTLCLAPVLRIIRKLKDCAAT